MKVPEHVQQVSQLDRKVVGGDDVCSRVDFDPKLVNAADNARADPFWKSLELAALNVDLLIRSSKSKKSILNLIGMKSVFDLKSLTVSLNDFLQSTALNARQCNASATSP